MGKRILIIEDEKEIAELMMDFLNTENFEVNWVDDGRKGIEKAKQELPDLIILDLMLHDLHGVNVCKTLKANGPTSKIPIVIYSGRMEPGVAQDVIKAGGDLYLSKTTPPSKVVQIIKDLLAGNQK